MPDFGMFSEELKAPSKLGHDLLRRRQTARFGDEVGNLGEVFAWLAG